MMPACIVCAHEGLEVLLEYKNAKTITSDNKIANENFVLLQCRKCLHVQKQVTPKLLNAIETIYAQYEAYYLSNGEEEEKKDVKDAPSSRSRIVLENIKSALPKSGSLLDLGTGTGVFLKEFSLHYDWDLYAQDVQSNPKNGIEELKNFKRFFQLHQDTLYKNHFEMISAIHLFEHILNPNLFLAQVKESLKSDGILLLQVPNIDENLLDIFTIDHVSHFNASGLTQLLKQHFNYVCLVENQISRELTVLASDKEIACAEKKIDVQERPIQEKIQRLSLALERIDTPVAIFGTSPAALFLAHYLNFSLEYFIDENSKKVGKQLYGKNILHPKNVQSNIAVIFPYSKDVFDVLIVKYPLVNFILFENI